ncbi:MAG: hypothetical protein ACTSYX_04840 [Candidatus Thorarchaeota archaeon]
MVKTDREWFHPRHRASDNTVPDDPVHGLHRRVPAAGHARRVLQLGRARHSDPRDGARRNGDPAVHPSLVGQGGTASPAKNRPGYARPATKSAQKKWGKRSRWGEYYPRKNGAWIGTSGDIKGKRVARRSYSSDSKRHATKVARAGYGHRGDPKREVAARKAAATRKAKKKKKKK